MCRRRPAGFTLIEVLVAFAIAALATVTLFRVAGFGIQATRVAGHYEEAVSRAHSHLAALGFDLKPIEGELTGEDGDGYRWRLSQVALAQVKPSRPNADDDDDDTPGQAKAPPGFTLFAVTIGISWVDEGRTREVVLHTERLGRAGASIDG